VGVEHLLHPIAVVWRVKIYDMTQWYYTRRIYRCVAHVIVALDMDEIDRLAQFWSLIKIARIAPQVRIIGKHLQVALEVTDINGIKADERGE
jgi:hypothetical protein